MQHCTRNGKAIVAFVIAGIAVFAVVVLALMAFLYAPMRVHEIEMQRDEAARDEVTTIECAKVCREGEIADRARQVEQSAGLNDVIEKYAKSENQIHHGEYHEANSYSSASHLEEPLSTVQQIASDMAQRLRVVAIAGLFFLVGGVILLTVLFSSRVRSTTLGVLGVLLLLGLPISVVTMMFFWFARDVSPVVTTSSHSYPVTTAFESVKGSPDFNPATAGEETLIELRPSEAEKIVSIEANAPKPGEPLFIPAGNGPPAPPLPDEPSSVEEMIRVWEENKVRLESRTQSGETKGGLTPVNTDLETGDASTVPKQNHRAEIPAPVITQGNVLPDWVKEPSQHHDNTLLLVVSGTQFATESEAHQSALAAAKNALSEHFTDHSSTAGEWETVSLRWIDSQIVSLRHVEEIQRSSGKNLFRVYREHLQLKVTPEDRSAVHALWKHAESNRRIWPLGAMCAFATLVFGTIAGYLRLDDRTEGSYRLRLKTAAVSIVTAGGIVACQFLV